MDTLHKQPTEDAPMGSLAWGRRQGAYSLGRLTRSEKIRLIGNLGRISLLETMDAVLDRVGLLRRFGADLGGLMPQETPLVRDACAFAEEVQGSELMQHSFRTYVWGMLLGGYRGLEVDREIFFSAAILHDVGLAEGRQTVPRECCFVVSGAERCHQHLVGKGHDRAKVRKIADAIGLHLNAYVSDRVFGAEAHLLSRGAMCDVFGMGRRRITEQTRQEVFSRHPRGDLINALEIWPGHHLKGTRADVLMRIGGEPKSKSSKLEVAAQAGE